MTREAGDLWERAREALRATHALLPVSPDAAASRAYYAAFYAASALFALPGKTFTRHSPVEAAVHRDLVRAGHWNKELGATYTELLRLREMGDYGGDRHVTPDQAHQAATNAHALLAAVSRLHPDHFPMPDEHD